MDNENVLAAAPENAAEVGISDSRRAFVKTAAQVAMTGPAVNILVVSTAKASHIPLLLYAVCCLPGDNCHFILDDFTFGNNEEEIDGASGRTGGNFSNWNGTNNQDDVFIP